MMIFPQEVTDKVKVQNLKSFDTNDGCAYNGTFCIGNTKIATVQNSGCGGDTDYRFLSDEAEAMFDKFVIDNEIKTEVLGKRYEGMDVDTETIFSEFMEEFIQIKETNKVINRTQKKGIVYSVPGSGVFNSISWKVSLSQMVEHGHAPKLQEQINNLKKKFKSGEVIMNTNLDALGLKA